MKPTLTQALSTAVRRDVELLRDRHLACVAREVANAANGATWLGLALAVARKRRPVRAPGRLWVVPDYPRAFPAPRARAVTIGNVVLTRWPLDRFMSDPDLLAHEARHATQWAACLGPAGFLPGYFGAALWSLARFRDPAVGNVFEQRADLAAGGYPTTRVARSLFGGASRG